ncbi:hypothetical protein CTI12_AA523490 [Artemisia annua]|uniref:KIB1-4 beta-propeller domain-containing protein n=1 Tax=Artemisia annua TaxID=35608 RepID=A0A2U1L709_ARTAN|nr:hypothetical protein CTI12_AA523490 [Artemisia annua]
MMEWSELFPEVLDIIARKCITSYEDYPGFAGVCKSWRLAAARTYRNSNGPPSRLPSFMLVDRSADQESRELFLLSNKSIRKIRLPEVYGKACRSSCGWLLTVGEDFSSQLINPLSREVINLPKADTFPDNPLEWADTISNVVLLMESKMVLVIWGFPKKLGFCHIGDNKWTSVEQPFYKSILDITFYNGQVYTLNCFDKKIQACNVNGKHPTALVDIATMPEDVYEGEPYDVGSRRAYIVGLDDGERKQLLVIIRFLKLNKPKSFIRFFKLNKPKSFKVFAYDLESGSWSKVKDFGKKTLFVGCGSSFWIEDTTGVIKGNGIYYIDTEYLNHPDGRVVGVRYTGIYYHMSNGTIEPHFTRESRSHFTPPLWLQSM